MLMIQTPVRKLRRRKMTGCSFVFGDDAEYRVWMRVKVLNTVARLGFLSYVLF